MTWTRFLSIALLCGAAACADGGQRGSGITFAAGNVASVDGSTASLGGIHVTVAGTDLATDTDDGGRFSVHGRFAGDTMMVFARAVGAETLEARLNVNIPAGGTLTARDLQLSSMTGEALPAALQVAFEGRIVMLACDAGRVTLVSTQRDPSDDDTYVLILQGSNLHDRQGRPRTCAELALDDRLRVDGFFAADGTIGNADVIVQ
ncbi:MAG TPA: hypothetical protein VGK30_14710 [Candidatus Binatia bacterium]